jgi:hypothetical protein
VQHAACTLGCYFCLARSLWPRGESKLRPSWFRDVGSAAKLLSVAMLPWAMDRELTCTACGCTVQCVSLRAALLCGRTGGRPVVRTCAQGKFLRTSMLRLTITTTMVCWLALVVATRCAVEEKPLAYCISYYMSHVTCQNVVAVLCSTA